MKGFILLAVIAGLVMVTSASGNPSPWYIDNGMTWARGAAGSTWQGWDFSTAAPNLAAHENVYNSYGKHPIAELYGDPVENPFGWQYTDLGRNGFGSCDAIFSEITIPNTPSTDGYIIWMEVGFRGVTDDSPYIEPLYDIQGTADVVEPLGLSYEWTVSGRKVMIVGWKVTPNQQSDVITFGFAGTSGAIDYVTVDTISIVPVPGAILLGGIGAGLVGWMKRRKTL
jgi:hypothetical protein